MSVNADEEFYRRFARALPYLALLLFPPTSPPFDLHKILNYNGLDQDRVYVRVPAHVSYASATARPGPWGTLDISLHLFLSLYP